MLTNTASLPNQSSGCVKTQRGGAAAHESRRLSDNARRLVETKYDYRVACCPLGAIYARLDGLSRTAQPVAVVTG